MKGQVPKIDPTITIAPGSTEVEETVHALDVLSRAHDYGWRTLVCILRWSVHLMKHIPGSTVGSYLGVKSFSIFIVPVISLLIKIQQDRGNAKSDRISKSIRYVPRILVPLTCSSVGFVSIYSTNEA